MSQAPIARARPGIEWDTARNRGDFDEGFLNDYDTAREVPRAEVAIPSDKGRNYSYPGKTNRGGYRGRGQRHQKFQDPRKSDAHASKPNFRNSRRGDDGLFSPQKIRRDEASAVGH